MILSGFKGADTGDGQFSGVSWPQTAETHLVLFITSLGEEEKILT